MKSMPSCFYDFDTISSQNILLFFLSVEFLLYFLLSGQLISLETGLLGS